MLFVLPSKALTWKDMQQSFSFCVPQVNCGFLHYSR